MDQGIHKPQGPAGPSTSTSVRANPGPGIRYLAILDKASESSSWNKPIYCVHVCSTSAPQSSSAEEEEQDRAVHVSVKAVCVYGVVAKALL